MASLLLPAGPERLRMGLPQPYAYYAANRDMIGNVLRDADLLPDGGAREGRPLVRTSA